MISGIFPLILGFSCWQNVHIFIYFQYNLGHFSQFHLFVRGVHMLSGFFKIAQIQVYKTMQYSQGTHDNTEFDYFYLAYMCNT